MMDMNNLVFIKDCFINKEIAYILGIQYKYIKEPSKDYLIFASDKKDIEKLNKKNYKYKKDYIDLNYLCDYLDKYNRTYEIRNRNEFKKI